MPVKPLGTIAAVCLAVTASLNPFSAHAQEKGLSAPEEVDMQWAVKVPMRDGVALNATVFRPHAQKEGLPVVFTLTPYIGDSYLDRALYFARHRYV
jgi:predicted acyl esterase